MAVPATTTSRTPTAQLTLGLLLTLAAVAVFSAYTLNQIHGLRSLQTQTVDRNRKDSLQLLRIQNDLQALGLAMRDMLDNEEPYPLEAWKNQFERVHADLNDALQLESQLAPAQRNPERQRYFANSLTQFWTSVAQVFSAANQDSGASSRDLIRTSLQPQQSALATTVARLLVQNNEAEEQAVTQIQAIYSHVERDIYLFVGAVLVMIALTSLYLIQFTRRLFDQLARLSSQRSDLARKLITMQEEVLRSIARELHDEFGQILTAIGAMLTRAQKQAPALQADLLEIREITQQTLEKTRGLSQSLHPAVLDNQGLEQAMDWYIPVFERQTGIRVDYEKSGKSPVIPDAIAIHVYRVLQEALNNLARHSRSSLARVRAKFSAERLELEIEDNGVGFDEQATVGKRGIGMVAMRERADLLHAKLEFLHPAAGGTLVRLDVPLQHS